MPRDLEPFTFQGKTLHLKSKTQMLLLATLRSQPGRIFERDTLLTAMEIEDAYDRVVDSHIKHLRKALAGVWPGVKFIETYNRIGYSWVGHKTAPILKRGPGLAWQRIT
jgi:two-component system response regulator BaeR